MSLENKIDMKEETDNYYYNPNWENWTLYKAIPTTLTIAAGLAGGYFVGSYFGNRNLKTENQVLKTEVQSLKVHLKELQNIGLRLTDLEQVIGLSQETNQELISKLLEPKPVFLSDREDFLPRHQESSKDDVSEVSEVSLEFGVTDVYQKGDGDSDQEPQIEGAENRMNNVQYSTRTVRFKSADSEAEDLGVLRLQSDVASPMISGEKASEQDSSDVAPQASSLSAAGRTPGKGFNPPAATKVILRTPAAKKKASEAENFLRTPANPPKTPSKHETVTKTQKMLNNINEAEGPDVTPENISGDIDKFISTKFSKEHGYNANHFRILKSGLSDVEGLFVKGCKPNQVYELLEDIFHGGALSIHRDQEDTAQFTEIFDALKSGSKKTSSFSDSAFKSVDINNPFSLDEEITKKILKYKDANSAYMFYLSKVIIATIVVAQALPGAEGQEINHDQDVYADDFDHEDLSNREDEASDDEITAQAESEQNSIVIKVEEVAFNEKFISLLPWYGKIVATSAASSVVKTSAAGAWQYFTYNTASEAVEIVGDAVVSAAFGVSLPKGCVGAFATPIASMAVFEAIYGQAEAAFNYVCSAPEALEAAGQEGIAYSA